jgi:hypothetical protein
MLHQFPSNPCYRRTARTVLRSPSSTPLPESRRLLEEAALGCWTCQVAPIHQLRLRILCRIFRPAGRVRRILGRLRRGVPRNSYGICVVPDYRCRILNSAYSPDKRNYTLNTSNSALGSLRDPHPRAAGPGRHHRAALRLPPPDRAHGIRPRDDASDGRGTRAP